MAIDGKTSRRAHGADGRPRHLVSAWTAGQRLELGQERCATKENEIGAIPRFLERLELRGALVTIDDEQSARPRQHGPDPRYRPHCLQEYHQQDQPEKPKKTNGVG